MIGADHSCLDLGSSTRDGVDLQPSFLRLRSFDCVELHGPLLPGSLLLEHPGGPRRQDLQFAVIRG